MVRPAKPLHPDSAKFCAFLAKTPMKGEADERRAGLEKLLANYPMPSSVEAIDLKMGGGDGVPCRLYKPKTGLITPCPTVLFLHGGGGVIGSLNSYGGFCADLCATSGVMVVSVGYRLSPEHPFPLGLEDSFAVLQWLADGKAASYGVDGNRLGICGDSHGGNLSIVLCMLARDAGLGSKVRYALPLNPATDMRPAEREEQRDPNASYVVNAKGLLLETSSVAFFINCYFGKNKDCRFDFRVSPVVGNLSGLPRMSIITCGHDPIRDEAEEFARKAKAAGSPVEHFCQEDEFHVWFLFPHYIPHVAEATKRFGRMLRAGLGLPPASSL